MGAPPEQLIIDEVAEEGTLGAAVLLMGPPGKNIISLTLQHDELQKK